MNVAENFFPEIVKITGDKNLKRHNIYLDLVNGTRKFIDYCREGEGGEFTPSK